MHDRRTILEFRVHAVRLWLVAAAVDDLPDSGSRRGDATHRLRPVDRGVGVLPPLSESAWQTEFEKYKQIPQYHKLNRGMSLSQFRVIYYWEWMHRLLARATGAVFLLPFLYFLWRNAIPRSLLTRLWLIFGSGAALGVVGWWLVSSGIAGSTLVRVSQYRLAFHLTLACAVYAAIVWTAQQLALYPRRSAPRWLRMSSLTIAGLLLLQIYLGALVAGLDAGLKYNTWPLIEGGLLPSVDRLFFIHPLWRNWFENDLMVQFNHRILADGIWLLTLLHVYGTWRWRYEFESALLLVGAVTIQAALGIVTLLYEAPLGLALAHQILAIVVFTIAIAHAERFWPRGVARITP